MSAYRRTLVAPVSAVLLPAYLAACFHYVPVQASPFPPPGTNIRATLTTPMPFNLGTVTINDVRRVEGLVVETHPDSVGVWVKWLYPVAGSKYDANSAQFYLHKSDIAKLEQWRVSGKGTALAVALTGALVGGMFSLVSFARGKTGTGDTGPKPGDNQ